MIKKIVFSLLLVLAMSAYSQNTEINNYKYIIVKDRFDFLKEQDQYQTSSLTKFLLQKKGFTVFLSNEQFPAELSENRCLALTAVVKSTSSLFVVKNKIELEDCYGKVVYSSEEGKSKEKDYKKGYHEAIRNACNTMSDIDYTYNPEAKDVLVNENSESVVELPIKKTIQTKVIPEIEEPVVVKKLVSNPIETLYAQIKPNGFQLVNTKPAIVFEVLKTNLIDVFIIRDKNGVMYKSKNTWIAEYYENNQLVVKQFDIKF
jgi:hypothetical protein